MSRGFDWVFWSVGGVLGLAGLLLAVWALFADRARGRRRCPKCWYDLSGTPGLVCSECGYIAKRERRLGKTRRRWRWAFAGALAVTLGITSALTPQVRRGGLVSVVPTTVLILVAPWLDTTQPVPRLRFAGGPSPAGFTDPLCAELVRRAQANRLWDWQWRLLAKRSWEGDDPPWTFSIAIRGDDEGARVNEHLVFVPLLEVDHRRWPWFATDLRAIVTPRYAKGVVMGVSRTAYVWAPTNRVSLKIPEDVGQLKLLIVVQRRKRGNTGTDRWREIWSGGIAVPVSVVRSGREIAMYGGGDSASSVLRSAALQCLRDGGHPVVRLYDRGDHPWMEIDGCMELRRDGRLVATARFWSEGLTLCFGRLTANGDRPLGLPTKGQPDGASWSVRLRNDSLRRRELVLPLCWDDAAGTWLIE